MGCAYILECGGSPPLLRCGQRHKIERLGGGVRIVKREPFEKKLRVNKLPQSKVNGRSDQGRGRRRRWSRKRTKRAMRAPAESRRESQTDALRDATKD